jgi:hypothetical protein
MLGGSSRRRPFAASSPAIVYDYLLGRRSHTRGALGSITDRREQPQDNIGAPGMIGQLGAGKGILLG